MTARHPQYGSLNSMPDDLLDIHVIIMVQEIIRIVCLVSMVIVFLLWLTYHYG